MDSVDTDRYAGWLTKAETASRLGRSLKTVQRLAAAHRIASVALRDPHVPGGEIWLYDPADVQRLATTGQPAVRPALVAPDRTRNGNGHASMTAIAALAPSDGMPGLAPAQAVAIAAIVTAVSRQLSTLSIQWLTVEEAAAETNRSQAYLRRRIKDGTLYAERDRGWRIRRRDLEAL